MSKPGMKRVPLFLVVGAWNTLVGYLIFAGLTLAFGDRLHHQATLVLAYVISIVHAYTMQRLVVFRSRNPVAGELARFATVNLVALALNAVFLEVLVRAGLGVLVAQLLAMLATTLLQFTAHQAWSFRARPENPAKEAPRR